MTIIVQVTGTWAGDTRPIQERERCRQRAVMTREIKQAPTLPTTPTGAHFTSHNIRGVHKI